MSIEQGDVVDIISIDKDTGHVILTISDHLEWSDTFKHQMALQAKFNKYLASSRTVKFCCVIPTLRIGP